MYYVHADSPVCTLWAIKDATWRLYLDGRPPPLSIHGSPQGTTISPLRRSIFSCGTFVPPFFLIPIVPVPFAINVGHLFACIELGRLGHFLVRFPLCSISCCLLYLLVLHNSCNQLVQT